MAVQKPVPQNRIRDIIEISALRNTPVALTCSVQGAWRNYSSRFLGAQGGLVWIEFPQVEDEDIKIDVGSRIGVAFKQRHHKYVFSAEVRELAEFNPSYDVNISAICVGWPQKLHQLQRRMFQRVDVPNSRQVFVEFWQGGKNAQPEGQLRDKLVFNSQLVDISAGGLQLRIIGDEEPKFRPGDSMGISIMTDADNPIMFDGVFRHLDTDEYGTTLGIQMAGLNHTNKGRKTLQRIADLIQSFINEGAAVDSEKPKQTA